MTKTLLEGGEGSFIFVLHYDQLRPARLLEGFFFAWPAEAGTGLDG